MCLRKCIHLESQLHRCYQRRQRISTLVAMQAETLKDSAFFFFMFIGRAFKKRKMILRHVLLQGRFICISGISAVSEVPVESWTLLCQRLLTCSSVFHCGFEFVTKNLFGREPVSVCSSCSVYNPALLQTTLRLSELYLCTRCVWEIETLRLELLLSLSLARQKYQQR